MSLRHKNPHCCNIWTAGSPAVQTKVSHLDLEAINYHLSPPLHRRLLTKTWHQSGRDFPICLLLSRLRGLRLDTHHHTHCIPLWLRADGKLSPGGEAQAFCWDTQICLPLARWHEASHASWRWKATRVVSYVGYYRQGLFATSLNVNIMFCSHCSVFVFILSHWINTPGWLAFIIELTSLLCRAIVLQNTVPVSTAVLLFFFLRFFSFLPWEPEEKLAALS